MTLLHARAVVVHSAGSGTYGTEHAVCLEWKHVAALHEQDNFMCQMGADENYSVFAATHVDMVYGKTYILKHPYKELLKAFMATRGET